jgi:hypothetical protein
MGESMEVTYNIQGDAAGAVIGKARSTLRLIKERTKCIEIDVGGDRKARYRSVRIKASNMKTVVAVKKIMKRLVKDHADKDEVWHQTLLIKHDDGWGSGLPDNVEEARRVE